MSANTTKDGVDSLNWKTQEPQESGFYWIRAHGGTPTIGFWDETMQSLDLFRSTFPLVLDPFDGFQTLAENGIEFIGVKLELDQMKSFASTRPAGNS